MKQYQFQHYEGEENVILKEALLKAFDPFVNEDIITVLREKGQCNLEDTKIKKLL